MGQPNYRSQGCFQAGVSVCIPAYNEEETIAETVYDAERILQKTGLRHEILVLDDCSTDRTWDILNELQRNLPKLQLRRHEINRGIAATFNELYKWASLELVFLNSADRQWPMSVLLDMLPEVDRYDLIVGRRNVKHYTLTRHIISWGFNVIPILLFGTRTYDAGSVKLVRREIYEIPLISLGVFAEAERIVRAKRMGYRIGSLDVDHFPRRRGTASGGSWCLIFGAILDMARVWIDMYCSRTGIRDQS